MEIPLSKKGWVSVIISAVLMAIMTGYFSAFGEDLYEVSKKMVFDTQTQYLLFIIFIIIAIGIVTGLALTVFDIHRQRSRNTTRQLQNPRPNNLAPADENDVEARRRREDDWRFFPSNYD
ncbi:MAG: hypothetical protein WA395_12375 [Nitrososphaeraceae archaeon]